MKSLREIYLTWKSYVKVPMADGGKEPCNRKWWRPAAGVICRPVGTRPLGRPVTARWGMLGDDTAVIEMAAAHPGCMRFAWCATRLMPPATAPARLIVAALGVA